jgi:diaminopimelate epimerase
MLIQFIKMQAQGNDFVVIDLRAGTDEFPGQERLAKTICDRRFGIGADGLVIITASGEADARMTIFNADGSRAEMCGSALRCVTWLIARNTDVKNFTIATDSGIRSCEATPDGASVDLGTPRFLEDNIYLQGLWGSVVDIGNLHFVCLLDELDNDPHLAFGPLLENDPAFPQGLNSQFIHCTSANSIEMVIWERGSGATFACGTGAVASVFTGIQMGILAGTVSVRMPGGAVRVSHTPSGTYALAGNVSIVFQGEYQWTI